MIELKLHQAHRGKSRLIANYPLPLTLALYKEFPLLNTIKLQISINIK